MDDEAGERDPHVAEPSSTEPILTAAAIAAGAGGVVTVMHVDVEGSTALTARAGDEVGRTVLSATKQLVQAHGEASGGTLIDAVGDAMMFTFTSTRSAITAAIAIQDALTEREAADPEAALRVRIGLNVGEVVGHDTTPFGAAVNAGARVMSMADGGEILVSEMVRRLAGTVPGVDYRDRGRHRFKGFDEPWRVYQLVWPGAPPARPRRRSGRRARWAIAAPIAGVVVVAVAAVWLLRDEGAAPQIGTNSVARLDGDSGAVQLAAPIGQRPGASAIGFDSLWVAQPDRGVVVRVDLEDGSVRDTVTVGASPAGVAVGGGSVWVTNSADGTVSRISPAVNEVTQTLPVGTGPSGIAYGDGALWVADTIGAALVRLDPASGGRDAISLAGRPSGVAFSPDGVWVTFDADGVARVDPRSRSVTFTKSVGNGPTAVLAALGAVWVANHLDGTVSRLEPSTGRLEATIPVGDGPSSLALAAGSIWVANEFDDSITSIDSETSTARDAVPTGGTAVSLAADGDDLWLAAGASATEHRGGTLSVSSEGAVPVTLDPAVTGDVVVVWSILSITGDGLLTYKKVGGTDGSTLVPDLASALPEVSADGRTYRFPLRQGIRYSTGAPVRPEDFRRGLERAIVLNEYAADLFGAIDGADTCARRKAGCDLSGSVVTDDEAVTVRLARPDPDLPFKLALPFAFPVPSATPMKDQRLKPIPSTGPYLVTTAGPKRIELRRNSAFEEWSGSAQPDGFVDAISWRFGEQVGGAFDRLEAGTLDWMASRPSPDDLSSLQTANPERVALTAQLGTTFVGYDVLRPPFDDVRVRRALNFAIDRTHVLGLAGGAAGWRTTCQIFPPTLEGYVPVCPYTSDPDGDVWTAPDLARAKELVEAAGAVGETVTVWVAELDFLPRTVEIMDHVVEVLNEIGLRATLEVVRDPEAYLDSIYANPTAKPGSPEYPQVYLGGWLSDFPRASDFIEPSFRCGAPVNISGYCNPSLDKAIDRVKALSTTNPGAASRGWTEIEHALVRDAVWAPLVNPVNANAFSARVGNVQVHPLWGVLLSRLWVQ